MARKSRKNIAAVESPKRSAMKVWRAALYIRLSVEFNSKKGDSLETQQQIMEAYIALRPDIEIAEVYTDNGVSGRTFEREAFQRMLSDVEAGKINCIVVKDLSRLGRNTIDSGYYIEPIIPTQSTPRAYGHVTVAKAWARADGERRHELNTGAGTLDRPIENVVATILHGPLEYYSLMHRS